EEGAGSVRGGPGREEGPGSVRRGVGAVALYKRHEQGAEAAWPRCGRGERGRRSRGPAPSGSVLIPRFPPGLARALRPCTLQPGTLMETDVDGFQNKNRVAILAELDKEKRKLLMQNQSSTNHPGASIALTRSPLNKDFRDHAEQQHIAAQQKAALQGLAIVPVKGSQVDNGFDGQVCGECCVAYTRESVPPLLLLVLTSPLSGPIHSRYSNPVSVTRRRMSPHLRVDPWKPVQCPNALVLFSHTRFRSPSGLYRLNKPLLRRISSSAKVQQYSSDKVKATPNSPTLDYTVCDYFF
ncbi:SOSS complex subunit C, partial [Lamprotornis superbus]